MFGDGVGALSSQTGAERQALTLATALLRSAPHATSRPANAATGWNVRTPSLAAVQHPMPRLFRPLPENTFSLRLTQAAGLLYLSSSMARNFLPSRFVAGAPLPHPFDSPGADYSRTLLIAAGSAASAPALIANSRMKGSRVIQVLHPRRSLGLFDAVVAPEHDFDENAALPKNVLTTSGSLHDISPGRLAAHKKESPCDDILALPRPRVAIALGGPRVSAARSGGWADADAIQIAERIEALACDSGGIVITVSRRTPESFTIRLQRELVGRLGPSRVLYDDGRLRSRYLFILAAADKIVVTADSVNMLSEAVASGSEVYIAGKSGSRRLDKFCKTLVGRGSAQELGCLDVDTQLRNRSLAAGRVTGSLGEDELQVDHVARAVWGLLCPKGEPVEV